MSNRKERNKLRHKLKRNKKKLRKLWRTLMPFVGAMAEVKRCEKKLRKLERKSLRSVGSPSFGSIGPCSETVSGSRFCDVSMLDGDYRGEPVDARGLPR